MTTMKISDWLETIGYDSIQESAGLKADFQACTGYTAPAWHEERLAVALEHDLTIRAVAATPADLREWRPIPAPVPRDTVVTYGITVAEAIEQTFIPGRRAAAEHYSGRGRNFSAIVQTLRTVGL